MARGISINQITTSEWGLREAVEAYARTDGVEGTGIWPDKLSEVGAEEGTKLVRDAGLAVSALVFIANFTQDLRKGIEDGRRSIQDAHALDTETLLVVAGPRLGVSTGEGERLTREGLSALSEEAGEVGVTLALEALHPVDATWFSTIVTLEEALDVIEGVPNTGIVFGTWNTWWDPRIGDAVERAAGRISLVHLADWRHPDGGEPRDRAVPGEGVAPLADLVSLVEGTAKPQPVARPHGSCPQACEATGRRGGGAVHGPGQLQGG